MCWADKSDLKAAFCIGGHERFISATPSARLMTSRFADALVSRSDTGRLKSWLAAYFSSSWDKVSVNKSKTRPVRDPVGKLCARDSTRKQRSKTQPERQERHPMLFTWIPIRIVSQDLQERSKKMFFVLHCWHKILTLFKQLPDVTSVTHALTW